jgi:DNA-binding SARP family transcriptional activator
VARLRLNLLGGFRGVLPSGRPIMLSRRKSQALLAYLAFSPGQRHARGELTALLWPDFAETDARHSLRQALVDVRDAFARLRPPPLIIEGDDLAIAPSAAVVDVVEFVGLAQRKTLGAIRRASAMYTGELLAGFPVQEGAFDEWLRLERDRLHKLAVAVESARLAAETRAGSIDAAVQVATRLLSLDPLHEGGHRALMQLYQRQGRRDAALRQYQICADMLSRELGVAPEVETEKLRCVIAAQPELRTRPLTASRDSDIALTPADAPFVGRSVVGAALLGAVDEGLREGRRIVVVQGEAGVGKSRLAQEAVFHARARGAALLIGRCYDMTRPLAFGPLVDALRRSQLTHDLGWTAALGSAWQTEMSRLLPDLAAPGSGTAPEPVGDASRLFESIAQLCMHLSEPSGLVVVVDDLQWADAMSLRMLGFLAHRLGAARVVIVVTLREDAHEHNELASRLAEELRREPHVLDVRLSPLERGAVDELIAGLMADRDVDSRRALGDQVWRLSGGVPFAVLETLHALRDPSAERTLLPLSIRLSDMIHARVVRLDVGPRQVADAAAVVGRDFAPGLIQEMLGLPPSELGTALDSLVGARLLRRAGAHVEFAHERLRDKVLNLLPARRRTELHVLTARALERLGAGSGEIDHLAIGSHFLAGKIWSDACGHLYKAGAHAYSRWALLEAVTCWNQALTALAHVPPGGDKLQRDLELRLRLRGALTFLAEHQLAHSHVRRAERLALALGDRERQAAAAGYRAICLRAFMRYRAARAAANRALTIAVELGDPIAEANAKNVIGNIDVVTGNFRKARESLRQSLEMLEGAPLVAQMRRRPEDEERHAVLLAVVRYWTALCLAEVGAFPEALAIGRRSVGHPAGFGAPYIGMVGRLALGATHLLKGDIAAALPILEEARDAGRHQASRYVLPIGARLGYVYAEAGRRDEALAVLEPMLERARSGMYTHMHPLWSPYLGAGLLRCGQRAGALAFAERSLAEARRRGDKGSEAWLLWLLGRVASTTDQRAAIVHYHDALTLAETSAMAPLTGRLHAMLAHAYEVLDDSQTAEAHRKRARDTALALGMRLAL